MDLFQQNDSGIMVSNTPPTNNSQQVQQQASTSNSSYLNKGDSSATLGNLKPPKTPSRMYSRDRSNHSMSMAYSSKKNRDNNSNRDNNNDLNESLNLSHNQHLSRRNSSANNNLSILDSDAQSLPQGTFAMKAGPQTVMSQWVITLDDDDDDDDEDEEDEEDVDCDEDLVDEKNLVEVCDDSNRNNVAGPNAYVPGLLVQNHMATHGHNATAHINSTVLSDQEEKWEDALASRLDLLSTSSVNNQRQASNRSPNPIRQILQQQQQNKLNESNLSYSSSIKKQPHSPASTTALGGNSKYMQHSMSDNLLNYERNLADAVNESIAASKKSGACSNGHHQSLQHQDANKCSPSGNNLSLQSPPHSNKQKQSSTPNSTATTSLPSPPMLPTSQPPSLNNSLDPFQTLLNQILADNGNHSKNVS